MKKNWIILCMLPLFFLPGKINAQKVAEKTNLLYWATSTPNFGLEVMLHNRWSLDFSVGHNPWDLPDNLSLRHWLVRMEPRFWMREAFKGHFFGVNGVYAAYNIGNIPFIDDLKEHTYKGNLYGGGLTYGYHFVLNKRWGLELSLSGGYLRMEYDQYFCSDCRELIGHTARSYIGPTRAAVSLVFML
ncbi:hypothetical protein M2137_001530 [Parabacteroides sp. PFB2-10]|uniref:DUF3575 domain-containing protein n=1 Tax=Parabacteroides sp. PFB2-10 TaxID=1742405 RepID=UPI00247392B9|nr:DUF3575 domain-containing protein [Parabacteroides sp. PFB2-10]MDH6312755.1 hypothetical protein [Parabacteroides sp. PFB2-10]